MCPILFHICPELFVFSAFFGEQGVSFLNLVLDQDHPPALGARASEFNGDQAVHGSLEGKAGRIQWSNINDHGRKKAPPKLVGGFFLEGGEGENRPI